MNGIKFYVKIADSIYFPGRKQYFENFEYYSKAFKNAKVLEYPISSLHFDRGRKYIYTIDNSDVQFEMHTLDDKVFEKFFLDLWQAIKKSPTPQSLGSSRVTTMDRHLAD